MTTPLTPMAKEEFCETRKNSDLRCDSKCKAVAAHPEKSSEGILRGGDAGE